MTLTMIGVTFLYQVKIFLLQIAGVDFTKCRNSKISHTCKFQPIKSLEITLMINLRLTTFCEIAFQRLVKVSVILKYLKLTFSQW